MGDINDDTYTMVKKALESAENGENAIDVYDLCSKIGINIIIHNDILNGGLYLDVDCKYIIINIHNDKIYNTKIILKSIIYFYENA